VVKSRGGNASGLKKKLVLQGVAGGQGKGQSCRRAKKKSSNWVDREGAKKGDQKLGTNHVCALDHVGKSGAALGKTT